jgi:hypothetical protein
MGASAMNISTTLTTSFNLAEANKHVWLSAAAYCGAANYKTHAFSKGPTTGFKVTYVIDDKLDTNGFVGYLPSDASIYVVYRGSQTIENWITNIEATKSTFKGDCCGKTGCEVHHGFYSAEQTVFPAVLAEVKRLKSLYPTYKVKCTGHSLGAALAQLTAMDLVNAGVAVSQLYNFGQPRVGNAAYAACASNKVATERVTHLKDMVPHVPYESWGFVHECREAYESTTTSDSSLMKVKDCSATNCDDSTCAEQWSFYQTNVDDHLIYLGLRLSCDAV